MRCFALAAVLSLTAAFPASAQTPEGFQTPSHNIFCMAAEGEVRCDVMSMAGRAGPAPRDCDLDWGDAFAVGARGGYRVCHGDTVADRSMPVLGYGGVFRAYGVTCLSQTRGVTCRNRLGHGFWVSRGGQRVF